MQITIDRMQIVGLCGVVLVLVGCVAPLFQVPIVGSVSFVADGRGDGSFVAALAVLLSIRAYAWVAGPAIGATIITLITLFEFFSFMWHIHSEAAVETPGSPFTGLLAGFAHAFSPAWGWAPLFVGLSCLFVAASSGFLIRRAGTGSTP
jgi:hypothetical protein